jgi:flavorubredoxin
MGSYGWGTNAVNYLKEVLAPLEAEILDPVYIKGHPEEEAIRAIHAMADVIEQRHETL